MDVAFFVNQLPPALQHAWHVYYANFTAVSEPVYEPARAAIIDGLRAVGRPDLIHFFQK